VYEGDSFFTLTPGGRIGLVLVSICLAGIAFVAVAVFARGRALILRLAIAAGIFCLFVWLAPQMHYFYYRTIFDGLPWQSVVKAPPSPVDLLALLAFRDPTLSAHATALLGWALLGIAALRR